MRVENPTSFTSKPSETSAAHTDPVQCVPFCLAKVSRQSLPLIDVAVESTAKRVASGRWK